MDARYLSAAICSVSLCCSTLPASPDALAGAFALSRIVSCKLSDIHAAYLRMKKWSSICRNTRYPCRLTEGRGDFFKIKILVLFVPPAFLHLRKANPLPAHLGYTFNTLKDNTLHGCPDGGTDQTVEPVVVWLFGSLLPFVHTPSAGFGLDEVLGG